MAQADYAPMVLQVESDEAQAAARQDSQPTPSTLPSRLSMSEQEVCAQIEGSEMDIYCCYALTVSRWGYCSKRSLSNLPSVLVALVMQLIIPYFLLTSRLEYLQDGGGADNSNTSYQFRYTGFVIYLYSVWNLYEGCSDDARSALLKVVGEGKLSFRYMLPALLGELVNNYLGFVLSFSLFANFSSQLHPSDLIINAMSVMYLTTIDNDLATNEKREAAKEDFHVFLTLESNRVHWIGPKCLQCIFTCFSALCYITRYSFPVFGVVLSFVFVLAKEDDMVEMICDGISKVAPNLETSLCSLIGE